MPADIKKFSSLVEHVYQAALEPRIWSEVPRLLADLQQSPQSMLFAMRLPGVEEGFMYPYGVSESAVAVWESGAAREDIWAVEGVRRGMLRTGNVMRDTDIIPDEVLLASEYYEKFLKPQDSRFMMTGVVFDGSEPTLPPAVCSVLRGHAHPRYTVDEADTHRMVINHISRAMGTMWRLRARDVEVTATHAALDRLRSAVLLLDDRARVSFANVQARRLLQQEDGLALKASPTGDRLVAADDATHRELEKRLARTMIRVEAVEHFLDAVRVRRPSGRLDYVVQVSALSDGKPLAGEARHRMIVFISDPAEECVIDSTMLKSAYGLTPAEVRLAEQILMTGSLPEIAERMGTSQNTVRSQLKTLFAKTRTNSQSQLMKLLMSMRG
jgi:DNA-binding CsgD family transcriptional regulator